MKVVVVGGGIAGLAACTSIRSYLDSSKLDIVLVEPKDHIEVFWATYRSLFDRDVAESSTFLLDKYAAKHSIQHIQSTVEELTGHQIKLANGDVIEFDACVLAMGASMPYPGMGRGFEAASNSRTARLQALQHAGEQLIDDTETLLIVGGGLVGAELAGDVAAYSQNTAAPKNVNVILVHSGDHLCPEMSLRGGTMVQKKLEALGVQVILNDKAVENSTGKMVLESSGKVIEADRVVMTVGIKPMNSFVDPAYLNSEGWIDVDDHFQIKGAEGNLFAFGDCCTLLPNAGNQILHNMSVIGYNVKETIGAKCITGGSGKKARLSRVHAAPEAYICSVGPTDGVAYTPWCSFDWILPRFKNYSMFLFEVRHKLGLVEEDKAT